MLLDLDSTVWTYTKDRIFFDFLQKWFQKSKAICTSVQIPVAFFSEKMMMW